MTKEGYTKIENCKTSRVGIHVLERGYTIHMVKINCLPAIFLYFLAYIRQTGYIVMMAKGGAIQNGTFDNYSGKGSFARTWSENVYREIHCLYDLKKSFFPTPWRR